MKSDTEDSATRNVQFSQMGIIPSVLLQTPVPRMDVAPIKKKMQGSATQNARNISRVWDLYAGGPVVTSVAHNSKIPVSPAIGGFQQKHARSQDMGVELESCHTNL